MGLSHSWAEVAGKFTRLEREVANIAPNGVAKAAQLVKRNVTAIAPSRLRGVGKRGAKLSVKYDVRSTASNATAVVRALGPWQLIERDTHAHRIPRARRRGRKRYVKVPGADRRGIRAFANHPGTHGKHPWAKGVAASIPKVEGEFRASLVDSMRKAFGG